MSRLWIAVLFAAQLVLGQDAWCGKNYQSSQPIVPPGGEFPVPATSSTPLLALRCSPAIKPYLASDASSPAGILIDSPVTYQQIIGAVPVDLDSNSSNGTLSVKVSLEGHDAPLVTGTVPLNASKFELPFSLTSLQPRKEAYNLTCSASYASQIFVSFTNLTYLPDRTSGSITKMDLRTGALLAKPVGEPDGEYEPIFPIGFYSNFGGYLDGNLSVLDDMKSRGFTIVHPVPTYDNLTAFNLMVDRMEELGLYLMYDMRWTYTNLTSVSSQVESIKNRTNLLLWYTADEPDGWGDPLNATSRAYDLINSLDGYHPVSLVLNCANYYFPQYAEGADILMQDTYPVGINATWSVRWDTECTEEFGDCGCDDCVGNFGDISERMDEFGERMEVLGWERTKAVWTVPQAFGGSEYWSRAPTGKEWVVESVLAINHGALGIVPWVAPAPDDIWDSATSLAQSLVPTLKPFLFNPTANYSQFTANGIDAAIWTADDQTLLLATNLKYQNATLSLADVPGGQLDGGKQVFDSGARLGEGEILFEEVGTGAFVFRA